MGDNFAIQLFENKQVRVIWDADKEKYFFSVVDIVQVLTDSPRPRKYWNALKTKLKAEGDETSQKLGQLKLLSQDGKKRLTDVADLEEVFRIIQSIPSSKAEPLKRWLAGVGRNRINQMIDPEQTFQMAVEDYRRQGYSAQAGGRIAKNARQDLEKEIGHSVISPSKASDVLSPIEDVEAEKLPESKGKAQ